MVIARFVVYYQELPARLLDHLSSDGFTTITKDGARPTPAGVNRPRITLLVQQGGDRSDDRRRVSALSRILDQLERSGEIVSYQAVTKNT